MGWDFINITFPKAAKDYRCEECSCVLPRGEKHCYTAGRTEGEFMDYRLCLLCNDLAQAWCREWDDGEGWPMGELRTSICEEAAISPDQIPAWLAEHQAKRKGPTP